ncbi:hypothetical protein CTAYLR_005276 [Chrysophaeum taylorii]|uniref:SGF29 C-terminal domain-containing protein n=1 Tax=Chrysophaeum taylorii TaxID=2483200 RepID=A0AAD7XLA6_9STRA|nr:hypothetical protein CTAYLR_005276 [Chrysophaeum taylorii]
MSATWTSSSTVIEDILESIANVPNSVKRNFELLRELDGEVATLLEEIGDAEAAIMASAREAVKSSSSSSRSVASALGTQGREAIAAIAAKRRRCDDLSDEKILIAEQTSELVLQHIDIMNSELAALSAHLHATGEFESSGAAPNDEVAVQLDDSDKDSWILARVVRYKPESANYDVADADDDRKVYELPETRVVPLTDSGGRGVVAAPHALAPVASILATVEGSPGEYKISKGDEVFAVYPDTTSFYSATVSIPPRRALAGNAICHVQFSDDADETGLNPDRAVPLKYIIRLV